MDENLDIYGKRLKAGHCKFHPPVAVPYPCPLCAIKMHEEHVVFEPEPEVWSGEENPRVSEYDGQLDDFLASDVQGVHFEATDQAQWYATVTMRNGEVWQLRFGATNPRARGYAIAEKVE
jgi:hypothetical protein